MNSPDYTQDTCSCETDSASTACTHPVYSSDYSVDMEKEYVYQNYPSLQQKNNPQYGVSCSKDVHIKPLYFDELCYLLSAEGAHLILFGGPWDEKTQSAVARINYFAAKYGVDTVYNFDFRVDSESPNTNFKADLTQQEGYDGPGKKEPVSAANCNYIYGELVSRFLTNADDWADPAWGRITWLNLYQDLVTVPDLKEPFLFLYNKDNTVDNSGKHSEAGTYPIVSAMHFDWVADADGVLSADGSPVDDPDGKLEAGIFSYIGKDGNVITPYTHQDYMYEAFRQGNRGHSFKTEDCFKKGEQINICPIPFAELYWLVQQEGSFVVFFCGAWCANSQAGVATVNDYAVANNIRVYMVDGRADGKYPIDFWFYPRVNELRISMPALEDKYFDLWETYLAGAPLLCTIPGKSTGPDGRRSPLLKSYVDKNGEEHSIYPVDFPYLVAVNKDNVVGHGRKKPVLAACNHGGIELLNYAKSFVYYKPNYMLYSAGVFAVINAYCDSVGITAKDKAIDRTAPIVEGATTENPNIKGDVKYTREHDWNKEMDENGIPYPWALGPQNN